MTRVAVLLSGTGTSLQNLIDKAKEIPRKWTIPLVISNKPQAYGIQRAIDAQIPHAVVDSSLYNLKESSDVHRFSQDIFQKIKEFQIDYVVLAGFLCFLQIPPQWDQKVLNVHPSLLPAFGGKGMYGLHVHKAALQRGVHLSGCTVHFVDNEFDEGPIIAQQTCPVYAEDTPETLAQRVQETERLTLVQVLDKLSAGRVQVEGKRVSFQEAST